MARHGARLLLVLEPEEAGAEWVRRANELRRVVERRFPDTRLLTVHAGGEVSGLNHPRPEDVEAEADVVVPPRVEVAVQDPGSLRPPEITHEELSMLLGPYPGEESA
ncbi:hypothetical protein [Mucisphaera calidilacus]|uniref:hypothetical protein n=1 Tax=Mucisphaera calidilacus TaxID=2527982 RepID=UPI0011A4D2B5|nr:hypothetical protein [Mucisphaera calidilacus]